LQSFLIITASWDAYWRVVTLERRFALRRSLRETFPNKRQTLVRGGKGFPSKLQEFGSKEDLMRAREFNSLLPPDQVVVVG